MIRINHALAAILALIVCAASLFAASRTKNEETAKPPRPNLSGTWILDKVRSDPGAGIKTDLADVTLTIVHKEPEIRITREIMRNGVKMVEQSSYTTEPKQPESKPEEAPITKVVTEWKGRRLVTTVSAVVQPNPKKKPTLVMEMREELELSKDGKTLTQKLRRKGVPGVGALKAKFVFSKVT